METCCSPARPVADRGTVLDTPVPVAGHPADPAAMVALPGGAFLMGTDDAVGYPADGEGPVREVTVSPFWIDATAVTNEAFAEFVDATGWTTLAERFGWSFVFAGLLGPDDEETRRVASAPWWRQVFGADWRHPEGPVSHFQEREDHPVIHLTWRDARAFARWAGKQLPTEAEWERAARGGLVQARYPWGEEREPGGGHRMNVWQGRFPEHNTVDDGWLGTAPVNSFPPNDFGLYNMAGNVWEWCADWFSPVWHRTAGRVDPTGPPRGEAKVMRGGSYLCHDSYCNRYRVAARSANTPDSSTGNLGFRCVAAAL